jgi:hypothetical protein
MTRNRPLHIAFPRPSLGIGGAERLVVDAALGLVGRGHAVTFFVGDGREAQLDEVRDGLVRVVAVGRLLPRQIAQRLFALPISETLHSVVRRLRGQGLRRVFLADQQHVHHRLLGLGLSHRKAVLLLYGVSLSFSLLALSTLRVR